VEAALVDAVFSARAVYNSKRGRGVKADVVAWRATRARTHFTLDALLTEIDDVGPVEWARRFGNLQASPGRPPSAPGGTSKASTVRQAAQALIDLGITTDTQIDFSNIDSVKRTLRSVPGIGYATVNYFLILLGLPGVKPDRMIHRFLKDAAKHEFTDAAAEQTITAAAQQLGVQPHVLDHAIWSFESKRAQA
jgi:hypothetical protein